MSDDFTIKNEFIDRNIEQSKEINPISEEIKNKKYSDIWLECFYFNLYCNLVFCCNNINNNDDNDSKCCNFCDCCDCDCDCCD